MFVIHKGNKKKLCCSLDPINVSKLAEAHESAAPAVGAIINSYFDEGHFVASAKRGLIQPYLNSLTTIVHILRLQNKTPQMTVIRILRIQKKSFFFFFFKYLLKI